MAAASRRRAFSMAAAACCAKTVAMRSSYSESSSFEARPSHAHVEDAQHFVSNVEGNGDRRQEGLVLDSGSVLESIVLLRVPFQKQRFTFLSNLARNTLSEFLSRLGNDRL